MAIKKREGGREREAALMPRVFLFWQKNERQQQVVRLSVGGRFDDLRAAQHKYRK